MPNNGSKIYSETRSGVKYGVDLAADVCKVLRISTTDDGYACSNRHGKINMWARYKPIESPIPRWNLHKMYAQKLIAGSLRWVESEDGGAIAGYRGPALDCGISVEATSVINSIGASQYEWKYIPPRSRFNLAHFDGYNHTARPPFSGIALTGVSATVLQDGDTQPVNVYAGQTLQVALNPSIIPNDGSNLMLSDISINGMTTAEVESLDDAYFGIAVFGAQECLPGDFLYFFTADERGGRSMEWNAATGAIGSSKWIVPVLARERQRRYNDDGSLASLVSNMVVRVPGVPVVRVDYVSEQEAKGISLSIKAQGYAETVEGGTALTGHLTVSCMAEVENRNAKAYVPTELTVTLLVNGVSKAQYYKEYPFGNPDDTGGKIIGIPANGERGLLIDLECNGYKKGDDIEVRASMMPGIFTVTRKVIMPVTLN